MASSTKETVSSSAARPLASALNERDSSNPTAQACPIGPRASSAEEKPPVGRRYMIDGIAVSPQILQALRQLQRSPPVLSSAGHGGPASASLHASPSQQLQLAAHSAAPGVARIASVNPPGLSTAVSAEPEGAAGSSRSSKRPRVSDEQRPTSAQQGRLADAPASRLVPDEGDEVSVSGGDDGNGASMDSDSEDDNAHMEQLISLQRMVEQLTELASENSARIQGFNHDIDELMRSRGVLSSRVDTLHLQLHNQQIQITDLQQQLYQMQMRVAPDAHPLQRSASSFSHFEL